MGDIEKDIIKKVKFYLKCIRELRIYRDELIEEINDYSIKAVDISKIHTKNKTHDTSKILSKKLLKKKNHFVSLMRLIIFWKNIQ